MNNNLKKYIAGLSIKDKIIIIDIISVIISYFAFNYLDILTHDYKWIQFIKTNGLLHIYDTWGMNFPIDLPPLYLIWLNLIKGLVGEELSNYTQLIMKLLPLLVQVIAQVFIYKKLSPEIALKWSMNIAILFNIVIYGQRDGVVGFLIVLLFYSMSKKKWLMPALIVALMSLFKPQGLYFIFILLLYYIVNRIPKIRVVSALSLSAAIGYMFFLPFSITSGDLLLPFKLYLFAFKLRNTFGSIAGNLWGLFEYWSVPLWITRFSFVFLIICTLFGCAVYYKTKDFIYTSILYLFSVFLFTLSQQGRYSIYTMFALFAAIHIYNETKYEMVYKYLMLSVTLAQLGMIAYNRTIVDYFGMEVIETTIQMTYSMLNMLRILRYIFIIITFAINGVCFVALLKINNNPETDTRIGK